MNYIIEGLDRLGKSTLTNELKNKFGYYQIIHMSKPQVLQYYSQQYPDYHKNQLQELYQRECFDNLFKILTSEAKIICDRSHLGEYVYSPLYRQYSGEYVFDIEKKYNTNNIKMVLLIENFEKSKHFVDDGLSLGSEKDRPKEQELFIEAFNKSNIINKKIVCVTGDNGNFKTREEILNECIS